jgi:hypothetical protein
MTELMAVVAVHELLPCHGEQKATSLYDDDDD